MEGRNYGSGGLVEVRSIATNLSDPGKKMKRDIATWACDHRVQPGDWDT